MEEQHIDSLTTILELVEKFDDPDYLYFFRGHSNKQYKPKPYIYRDPKWFSNEHRITREIISRCPTEFNGIPTAFQKLVKMQHYSLPTRLLDITTNPLVALFFTSGGKYENDGYKNDGELIVFKIPRRDLKFYDSDTVSVLSNLAWVDYQFEVHSKFSHSSTSFHSNQNIHASKLMHCIKEEKPYFLEKINPNDISRVLCVRPMMDNPRLIKQDGAFLLFGINGNKSTPAKIPEDWILYPGERRLIIKSSAKIIIRRQLASLGFSSAYLFPEIDIVSKFIKEELELEIETFKSTIPNPVPAPKTAW